MLIISMCLMLLMVNPIVACGPGRTGGRRRLSRKLTPLVIKQHVPNLSENSIAASGLSEGRRRRHDDAFKRLVPNYNPNIVFKDDESNGADGIMTKRLKEKLNILALSVMNQWPGVKLRVIEAWDEEGHHAQGSLHYEGRAADITTSDRDPRKYGMLARLAVEAGFDWVFYESRFHIHLSVSTEESSAARSKGCFSGSSSATTIDGGKRNLDEVKIGDKILAIDSNGKMVWSEVILFIDRDPSIDQLYYRINTDSGATLTVTGQHLIFVATDCESSADMSIGETLQADKIETGHCVRIINTNDDNYSNNDISNDNNSGNSSIRNNNIEKSRTRLSRVISVTPVIERGLYAPLTLDGTIVVDNVVCSCYALIESHSLAHWAFSPLRVLYNYYQSLNYFVDTVLPNMGKVRQRVSPVNGVHWYPKALYNVYQYFTDNSLDR